MTIQMILITMVSYLLMMQFMRPQPPAAAVQSVLQQAQQLEKEGRESGPNIAVADRVKKLDQAAQKYEAFYNQNKSTPEGMQARFQQVNVFEYLANLEGKKAGTHWYDRAEQVLKDMEHALNAKTGTVNIERNGEVTPFTGKLTEAATTRLNEIRAARDVANRDKITYKVLDFFVKITSAAGSYSYFLALLIIVVVLKGLSFPFQKKQYKYTQDMMRIQPLVKEVQEKMKDRPQEEVNKRIMQVYKENDVNIAAGCLPMLVMMFVLLPVFWMVRDYEYQFVNGHFLWIGSEFSKQYWWIGKNLAQFDVPLFVLYLVSTMGFSLMQPKPADPQQAQQQKIMMFMMPLMFGFFMWQGQWSSAFMLYWLVLNIVSMYQSWLLMRHFPATPGGAGGPGTPAPVTDPAPTGRLEPMKGVHTKPGEKKKKPRGRPGWDSPA